MQETLVWAKTDRSLPSRDSMEASGREYTDLGLGMQGQGEMPRILASWGYSVKPFVCRGWVSQYRLEGAHEMGNITVFLFGMVGIYNDSL